MRVGIDGISLLAGTKGGIGRYVYALARNFAEIDSKNEYFLYFNRSYDGEEIRNRNIFQKRVVKAPWALYKHVILSWYMKHDGLDLFHSPTPTLPLIKTCKLVMTIHEVSHEFHPEWYPMEERLYWAFHLGRIAARNADKIIADSASTKNDVMRLYKVPEDKVEVVYLGVDNDKFRPVNKEEALEKVKKKYRINGRFILYVGVLFAKRNMPRLLKAFSTLKRYHNVNHKLVIVGRKAQGHEVDLHSLVHSLSLDREVVHIASCSDKDLLLLYNAAELFVYPSLYEGFGLPPLEAMACGTPVITSDTSSMPEIVADAGILIDPRNVNEMADAMYQVASDEDLRSCLSKAGPVRSKYFTWEKTAQKTLAVYNEVAQK